MNRSHCEAVFLSSGTAPRCLGVRKSTATSATVGQSHRIDKSKEQKKNRQIGNPDYVIDWPTLVISTCPLEITSAKCSSPYRIWNPSEGNDLFVQQQTCRESFTSGPKYGSRLCILGYIPTQCGYRDARFCVQYGGLALSRLRP